MKKSKIFYGWWIVVGSTIILAALGPPPVLLANVFQTPITAEFNITNSQYAVSNFLTLGVGIFISPIISDKLTSGNFKRTFIISLIIYTLAYMGYSLAPNIYVYYLLSLLVGYGHISTTIIPASVLINNWFIHKRGLALSLALTGLSLGGTISSQLVNILISNFGWRQTYVFFGAAMLVIVLPIILFVIKVKPADMGLEPLGAEAEARRDMSVNEQVQTVTMSVEESRRKPFFILLIIGAVMVGLTNNGGLGQFPPALTEMHGLATTTTIISIYSGIGVVGKLVLGSINDRLGIVASVIYACTMLVFTYIFMLFSANVTAAFIMALFFGMGNAIGSVLPPLITSSIYSSMQYSKAYGYVQSGVQLGMTFGSLLAAGIADITGSYTYSWLVLMIMAVIVALLWVAAYKNAQQYVTPAHQVTAD